MVVVPSTLNVLTIGFIVVVFSFLWRMLAAKLVDTRFTAIGEAMAVAL